jgi:hypothetical protein
MLRTYNATKAFKNRSQELAQNRTLYCDRMSTETRVARLFVLLSDYHGVVGELLVIILSIDWAGVAPGLKEVPPLVVFGIYQSPRFLRASLLIHFISFARLWRFLLVRGAGRF